MMDRQARFEELYRGYGDRVHAYARRRSSHATADDVVSDVFLVVWRRLHRVPAEPLPWLLAVARRALANRRRAEGRAAALHERLADHYSPSQAAAFDDSVVCALAGLAETDRELLLLIAWEGLAQAEVAEVLGIGRGTVAMRLHRARRRFAAALAAQDDDALAQMEARR